MSNGSGWPHLIASPMTIRSATTDRNGEVTFTYDNRAVYQIIVNGRNVLMTYYIIGTCTGADDENNVISAGSDGRTLKGNPAVCAGSPFTLAVRRIDGRSIQVDLTVGPLTRDHKSMSVPMDCVKGLFQTFAFQGSGYVVGCGNSWSPRSGAGGRFDAIPQPCFIPGHGAVGIARANRAAGWVEIVAPNIATIRRTVVGGSIVDVGCVRHPYTENAEYAWVHDPAVGPLLRAGSVLRLSELITVTPWGAAPLPSPPPPSPLPPPPPPLPEVIMKKVTITIPGFTKEIEVGDQPLTVSVEVPLHVTVVPVGTPSPPPPTPPPPSGNHPRLRAAPFIGYGVVNRWPWIDPEKLAKALYEAGLTFTAIEWIPWWKSMTDGVNAPSPKGGLVTTTYPAEARRFIETMQKYSITTFVIMRNWNSEAEQQMSDADFRRDLQALHNIAAPADMLPTGRPVVCVEGVSEPSGSGKHMIWNRIVSDDWYRKGGKTLANRSGEQAGPFTWGDYHWCEDFTEANAKAALNNTDCGPVINPGPTRASRMTRAAINRDVGFLVYDFHKGPPELPEGIDFGTIAAMGVEIQKGGKGTYVWDPRLLEGPVAPEPGQPVGDDMLPIHEVIWLRGMEGDAADFAPVARLTNVNHSPGGVSFNLSGADGWPKGNIDAAEGNMVSFRKIDGKWYGATWEWLGPRTTERRFEAGRHVGWHMANGNTGQSPNERLVRERTPVSGEPIGHMVCSVVRGTQRTVNQRTNIVVVPHP